MNKFYFCFFLFICLSAQIKSQSLKTPYEKKVDEISTKAFKTIGVSESLISQAKKNNDWEIVLKSNEFFDITRNSNKESLKIWVISYSATLKEAEKLKNSEDIAKDKVKLLEKQKLEEQKRKKNEITQKEENFKFSDYSIVRKIVTENLNEWTKKSEFEKIENWKNRIEKKTDSTFQKFCYNVFVDRINFLYKVELGKYDAENEIFPFKLEKPFNGSFVKGKVKVPLKLAENFKNQINHKDNFEKLASEWRFADNNLFPTVFTISVNDENYNFITEIADLQDNTNISLTEIQYENKPENNFIFNFNKENEIAFERIKNKKLQVLQEKDEKEKLNTNADFPGGISRLRMIISENMDLSSIEGDIKGTVTAKINFIIDVNGNIKNIEASGNNKAFNDEAIRTIKSIKTKWLPAKKDGIPVESSFSYPMSATFQ